MRDLKGFVAYPSVPPELRQHLQACQSDLRDNHRISGLSLWEENDIVGRFLSTPILENIAQADFFVADITFLNFNVTFEIGYAIGKKKRVILIRNQALTGDDELIREVGIFDTLGHESYQNSAELTKYLLGLGDIRPLPFDDQKVNRSSPVYLVLPRFRTDWETRLLARVKKARLKFRSFDPEEQGRLSAREAIENTAQSHGIVIPLLPSNRNEVSVHNQRAAFVAGLAEGMGRKLLLIQAGDDPVPLDYRDLAKSFTSPDHIDQYVGDFASEITDCLQAGIGLLVTEPETFLANLSLGASAAENEFSELGFYYLETEEFHRTLNGGVQVVTGRKGSGKTALFAQVRDSLRRNKKIVVLDLKPEGFQLIKFREAVLDLLEEGSREHTVTAFWEYVLLLEICHKLLEKDKTPHLHNHRIYEQYRDLVDTYQQDPYVSEGDFAERMLKLTKRIAEDFQAELTDGSSGRRLTSEALTHLLYKHDVPALRDKVVSYLKHKEGLWILFDNLDKGWPAHGLGSGDITTLRCLLDSVSKLERTLSRNEIEAHCVVFIRNDVYELLVDQTPDRGKVSRVAIDWSDPDMLRELLRRRLVHNPNVPGNPRFEEIWRQLCISHTKGEESSQYLIDRCLMRPRGLIDLVQFCKSRAVNLCHDRIEEEDIRQGEDQYSTELLTNIGFEIRDVFPEASDILYEFIESDSRLTQVELESVLLKKGFGRDRLGQIVTFLLWYGFLGVLRDNDDVAYIYSVKYHVGRLNALISCRKPGEPVFEINQAFWAALEIRR